MQPPRPSKNGKVGEVRDLVQEVSVGSTTSSTIGLVSAVLAGFLGGRLASYIEPQSGADKTRPLDEVRARRLWIVNDRNEVCGGFQVGEGSASTHVTLWMKTPGEGKPSASLWVDELEGTPEAALMLISENGADHVPGKLMLRCGSGNPTAFLGHGDGAARRTILLGSESPESTSALSREFAGTKATWP